MLDILPYLSVTLGVTLTTVVFGCVLGGVIAYLKLFGNKLQRLLANAYTYSMRCTPSIILLFIVFYGLPKFLIEMFGYDINDFNRAFFVIITFTLLFAANISEIMRAAYIAVDRGQYEAAVSVGMSSWQAHYRIVFPQAAVIALPNFGNSLLNLLKEGSLAYTVGLVDLLGAGELIVARAYGASALEVYIAVGLIYYGIAIALEKICLHLEERFSPQKIVKV
ncbi:MAG: amino acid ABC transporter permease [Phascolarctobacterium sp.]|nr:amino acid ABC transporter permease [Phascolarctobacterium sp.]